MSEGRVRRATIGEVSNSRMNLDALDPFASNWNAMAELSQWR